LAAAGTAASIATIERELIGDDGGELFDRTPNP
jgi:hypothetical protein